MFKPTPAVVAALRDLIQCLSAVECAEAASHDLQLTAELSQGTPNLTKVLLLVALSAQTHDLALGRELTAACSRAVCAELGKRYPGSSIELRVPPLAAVQLGFGAGPKHTRGTPPNVVELAPDVLIELATGFSSWQDLSAQINCSGAQAADVGQAFPLTSP